jgi:hypothetical protein
LKELIKDRLYYLPSGSITSWEEMQIFFLEKYFLVSGFGSIRKNIYGIGK